ncbi:MAG: tRNA lysidine(34) synthetase TilS, partial [Eggerthellaceae bacterium]|nr:tRNA lysidine(34) synthetase TilS [Eggerthellaceae bacterium]
MLERILRTIEQRGLAGTEAPVLLMVSGGSDSTALAYLASDLREHGALGELAMLHVNHRLRGADADADAEFVRSLAEALGLAFFLVEIDVGSIALQEGANIEAVARRERYAAAQEALGSLCRRAMKPVCDGRIFTAHTADDRVESFYMRSIVGTGPGGFRSMRYRNGAIARPCMDVSRQDLRDYLARRALDVEAGEDKPLVRTTTGDLWREDATNAHTDQFRAYVRHEIVPKAVQRNARLLETLSRTMDLIADEDDMLDVWAQRLVREQVEWLASMQWNRESGAEA